VSYEIWDAETGNIVAWYHREDDALALIAGHIAEHGQDAVATWFFTREDGRDDSEASPMIAEDAALADLATRQRIGIAEP